MELELQPFPGATLHAAKFGDLLVVNFACSVLPEKYFAFYSIAGTSRDLFIFRPYSGNIDTKILLKLLTHRHIVPEEDMTYIITPSPIVPFLLQAKSLIETERRKKMAKRPLKRPSKSNRLREDESIEQELNAIPRFFSSIRQTGGESDGFAIKGVNDIQPLTSVAFPLTSAAIYTSRADPKPYGHQTYEIGIPIAIDISATTEKALLRYIEETMTEQEEIKDLSIAAINQALLCTYLSPAMVFRIYRSRESLPTVESIEKNKAKLIDGVNAYGKRFQDLVRRCSFEITIPPMPSEEAFRLLSRIEISISPKILDREFLLERREESDPLFEKVYQHLPADGSSESSSKAKRKEDKISFTYGALVDVGQIFTYGECAELTSRVKSLA
jgi:hypothetical protein